MLNLKKAIRDFTKRRDEAKADYERLDAIVAILTSDPTYLHNKHQSAVATMERAHAMNGGKPKRKFNISDATRKRMSMLMKKRRKDPKFQAAMLKAIKVRKAQRAAMAREAER